MDGPAVRQSGMLEQYASDAALVRCYGELGGTAKEDAAGIVRRAMAGEDTAVQALRKTAYYLALGFANLVAALNRRTSYRRALRRRMGFDEGCGGEGNGAAHPGL